MSNSRICIIGNNASEHQISDGGRIKIRLYRNLLLKNGVDTYIIDLDGWKKHLLKLFLQIKKAIKSKDTILIMAGPTGSRKIIPLVNKINHRKLSRVVYCPLGTGTIDVLTKKLNKEEVFNFLNNINYYGISDSKIGNELEKLDLVLPQNKILAECYKNFYSLNNVTVLNNFRDVKPEKKNYKISDKLSVIYVSRICEEKGIFDLIDSVKELNNSGIQILLDIYGDIQLSNEQINLFKQSLTDEIRYKGILPHEESISTIKKYDLFALPTKYNGEGTSGSLIEAFLSGTPTLVSSYSQAKILIKDKHNGYIFEIGNKDDLKNKLLDICNNKKDLEIVGSVAQEMASIYTFEYNKDQFLRCILGEHK